jgi:hypothetical protein
LKVRLRQGSTHDELEDGGSKREAAAGRLLQLMGDGIRNS